MSVFTILKKVRNLLPYLILISIYFFFVNLEAKKESNNKRNTENKITEFKSNPVDTEMRIRIPVIPYEK
tara:strand:+ start:458 stop:664 length:207 start_codon:yes stop_codon:yes gene_type:complete